MIWRDLTLLACLAAIGACAPGELAVGGRWKVNPGNVEALVESRNNGNAFAATEDAYYVAFTGVAEGLSTTDVFLRRFDRDRRRWGSIRRLSDGSTLGRAPVFATVEGSVVVAWISDTVKDGGRISLAVQRSADRGETWSDPVTLDVGIIRTRVPQLLSDGSRLYLCISNAEPKSREEVLVFASPDGGLSWTPHRFGTPGGDRSASHPMLAVGGPDHVVLSWFESGPQGRGIRVTTSRDGGESWSEPGTVNDSRQLAPRSHCLAVQGGQAVSAWTVRDGATDRVLIDGSIDGGLSWGVDRLLFEDHVRVITPVCKNLQDNRKLVTWSLAGRAFGELGMRILYDVVDAAAKAGGSGVQAERKSLVGPPVSGRNYQKFDVATAGSRSASAWAIGAPDVEVFVGFSSDLTRGFGNGVRVSEPKPHFDSLSPRIGHIEEDTLTLLYNSRRGSPSPTEPAARLGDLFLAVVELP